MQLLGCQSGNDTTSEVQFKTDCLATTVSAGEPFGRKGDQLRAEEGADTAPLQQARQPLSFLTPCWTVTKAAVSAGVVQACASGVHPPEPDTTSRSSAFSCSAGSRTYSRPLFHRAFLPVTAHRLAAGDHRRRPDRTSQGEGTAGGAGAWSIGRRMRRSPVCRDQQERHIWHRPEGAQKIITSDAASADSPRSASPSAGSPCARTRRRGCLPGRGVPAGLRRR